MSVSVHSQSFNNDASTINSKTINSTTLNVTVQGDVQTLPKGLALEGITTSDIIPSRWREIGER